MTSKKNVFLIFTLIFSVIGIAMLISGITILISSAKFNKNAVKINAVISNISYETNSNSHTVYINYEYNGKKYTNIKLNEFSDSMYQGKQITVLINPDKPTSPHGTLSAKISSIVVLIMGAVFSAIGIVPVFISKASAKSASKLMQEGRRLDAVVEKITINPNVTINGVHPYIIICSYHDEFADKTYLFRSKNLWTDPNIIFKSGDAINVYVQRDNYNKYFVDAESRMANKIVDFT